VPQDLGRPLQDLEISYRPLELRSQIEQVYVSRQTIFIRDVSRQQPDGRVQHLDVRIAPLEDDNGEILGASIAFTDVSRYHDLQQEIQNSNQKLETANEELQSTNEELETTNEELQSTNEELETTNEELQSTNEELETMNEELQSTNEELQTINDELRLRTQELNESNAFLNSILTSMKAGVIALNRQFQVISWNSEAENLWGLRDPEVQGESLFNLDIGLPVSQLQNLIRRSLAGDNTSLEITLDAVNRRGKRIQCRITCNPLFDPQERPQGVILIMEEVGS
jgi:two-component system, chemotaxis family, CheB/CheR fusion protein